jgi:DNA-repair protein XRCC2
VIEVQGPPGSQKSHMFDFLALTAVLPFSVSFTFPNESSSRPPTSTESVTLGGRDKSVAIFDCDGRWAASKLYDLLCGHIKSRIHDSPSLRHGVQVAESEIDALVRRCLARVHVFRPASSKSLAATLLSLPSYHAKHCGDSEFAFVFVDSISAFYWQDRYHVEEAASQRNRHNVPVVAESPLLSPSLPAAKYVVPSHSKNHLRLVCSALDHVRKTLAPVIFLSNWALGPAGPSSLFYRSHLPPPYPSSDALPVAVPFDPTDPLGGPSSGLAITHHLTVHPASVQSFPQGISLEDALGTQRKGTVERAQSVCILRSAGVEGGNEIGRFTLDLPR